MNNDYSTTKKITPQKDDKGYYFKIGNRRIDASKTDAMINTVTLKGDKQ